MAPPRRRRCGNFFAGALTALICSTSPAQAATAYSAGADCTLHGAEGDSLRQELHALQLQLRSGRHRHNQHGAGGDAYLAHMVKEVEQLELTLQRLRGREPKASSFVVSVAPLEPECEELRNEVRRLRRAVEQLLAEKSSGRLTRRRDAELKDSSNDGKAPDYGELSYKLPRKKAPSPAAYTAGPAPAPAAPAAAEEAPAPPYTPSIDVDTEMPYGDLEPFGREDTAQELTEASIRESDKMVDQLERAEVAEEKRAVFRALTRLRGAAITSFDGVARSQTGNIDEYGVAHKWRSEHPVHHLAHEEADVSKWAFPDGADF